MSCHVRRVASISDREGTHHALPTYLKRADESRVPEADDSSSLLLLLLLLPLLPRLLWLRETEKARVRLLAPLELVSARRSLARLRCATLPPTSTPPGSSTHEPSPLLDALPDTLPRLSEAPKAASPNVVLALDSSLASLVCCER
jgi:hypothetical protein